VPLTRADQARGGFTLVELIVGLMLALTVAGVAYHLILASQRLGRAQFDRLAAQDNLRAGVLIVASELRELGFDSVPPVAGLAVGTVTSSDVLVGELTRVRYRAMRGLGFTCAPPASGQIVLRTGTWLGPRQPAANVDSVALFLEGDPARSDDDAWVRARVTGVTAGACDDGAPGIALTLGWEAPAVGTEAAARMPLGGPVRIFEIMEIQQYAQDGKSWLGMRSVSRGEVIQPLLGPLAEFTLRYLDRADVPTSVPSDMRSVTVELRSEDGLVLGGRVALRNMARP
jgi:prepilin-type N-terminal cleavage/methylation domain-containing protein